MCSDASGLVALLCEVFVPDYSLIDRFTAFQGIIGQKFPFSLASSLQGFFDGSVGDGPSLPDTLAWFPLPTVELGAFFLVCRLGVAALIYIRLAWFLIDRLTPQTTV
jgi:hypothetical protein